MTFCAVAALDKNRGIGYKNKLPWHLPNDLKHFKSLTLHHTVIMGYKTFQSIGKPLKDRHNIVLTHQSISIPNVEVMTFEECLKKFKHTQEKFYVIGGAQIYTLFYSYFDVLYLTLLEQAFLVDTYFPVYQNDFFLYERMSYFEQYAYHFDTYKRKK